VYIVTDAYLTGYGGCSTMFDEIRVTETLDSDSLSDQTAQDHGSGERETMRHLTLLSLLVL
jgi:hypothetical protein